MKEKVKLEGVSETLLIPLYSRYIESKSKNPRFIDNSAIKMVESIDYDYENKIKSKFNIWGCNARTIIIDNYAHEIITKYPNITVLNLGCGLDNRFERLDNGKIKWYNLDFEDVINLRSKYIEKKDRVIDIANSILDFSWIDKIDDKNNVLVIVEGVLPYFRKGEVKLLFDEIAKRFVNVHLILELMSIRLVQNQKRHEVNKMMKNPFKWGVESEKDFVDLCNDYRFEKIENITDKMKERMPIYLKPLAYIIRKANNMIAVYSKI